jgi:xanthine dehydrogenase YagT iron-sulfur-binding subunit
MAQSQKARVSLGENTVIAFVRPDTLDAPDPRLLRRLRSQLRGLGAALFVLSEDGGQCLRPDDELELRSPLAALGARSFEHACSLWGVEAAELSHGGLALFVLDAEGDLRFSHRSASALDPLDLLDQALAQACRTRRELVIASLVSALTGVLVHACTRDAHKASAIGPQPTAAAHSPARAVVEDSMPVSLRVNGETHTLELPAQASLLDTLRERIGLTGTKKGCDHGQCGACTVLLDGVRVNACLTLAVMAQGEVTTIEGLAHGDTLHPMQAAFVSHDAFQCGFCTPGQIMSAVGLIAEGRAQEDAEIREAMSGNLCRCGAYNNIVHAIRTVQKAGG